MKRSSLNIPIADGKTRVRVRVESDECDPGSAEYHHHRRYLLTAISEQPMLIDCGLQGFDTLKVYHNGFNWVADAEAVISTKG
jgi:hypothetical protein